LHKKCWRKVIRPKVLEAIGKLADKAEEYKYTIRAGRTIYKLLLLF
jgi:adenylosuccinate lyase